MPGQIPGYYTSRKKRLLQDFDRSVALVRYSLVARYGEVLANTLQRDAHAEYERLIPEIPYIKGIRAKALNTFLIITAQELAAYKAMSAHGKSAAETWELCHQALRLGVASIPRWKRWLLKHFMFSASVKKIMAQRARQHQQHNFGDFKIEYLIGEGDDFDWGVNYLECGNYRFMMEHAGEAFAPYVCMSDITLSDALGWGLVRTRTLADGCDHCDFRFRQGGDTRISSMTPEVQETIERIRSKESANNSE